MHGVKRQRPGQRDPEDVARARAEKERVRIQEYTTARAKLASYKASKDYSDGALDLTTHILTSNPEFPSGWAYRRRILQHSIAQLREQSDLPSEEKEKSVQALLERDLDLTWTCLRRNPKEYAVWNHRKYILKTMPDPDWRFELKTVQGLLDKDARNYHGWDYRRYLVASIVDGPPPPTYSTKKQVKPTTRSELAYTTTKIAASFSNFSAWHYRSKLLVGSWKEQGWDPSHPSRVEQMDKEFELIKQALYTDPDDQSAWIYHRWLVGASSKTREIVRREIAVIQELLELEPESKWCLESLVYYDTLLARLSVNEPERQAELYTRCIERLQVLQKVDPLRRKRYADLIQELETSRGVID